MSNRPLSALLNRLARAAKKRLITFFPRYATPVAVFRSEPSLTPIPDSGHCASHREPTKARSRGLMMSRLLVTFALLLGTAFTAQAATLMCSQFTNIGNAANPMYLIDGANPTDYNLIASASTLGIDNNCTIRNFPASSPLNIGLINFQMADKHKPYLIIFDNVVYTGSMSCASITQYMAIYWVNGSFNNISTNCQDFVVPVDAIRKENTQTTAKIGVPFTYKLTLPQMMQLTAGGYVYDNPILDSNPLSDINIYDDLSKIYDPTNAIPTSAVVTYLGNTAYLNCSGQPSQPLGTLTNLNAPDNTHLHFHLNQIPAGCTVEIDLQVVLADTALNVPGNTFYNTATWDFIKTVNTYTQRFDGQNGITPNMTIAGPALQVTKTGTSALGGTTLNLGSTGNFTVDVYNAGNSDAWYPSIVDLLPHGATGGMCNMDPRSTVTVTLAGTPLILNSDYSLAWNGASGSPACQLTINMLSAAAKIGPGQTLEIKYSTELDANSQNGTLTNIAVAKQWYNVDINNYTPPPGTTLPTLTCPAPYTGTVGTVDCQDAHNVTVYLSGYWFEKAVANVTTGADPSKTAGPGNTLHYTIYLKASSTAFNNVEYYDQLPSGVFDFSTLVFDPLPAGATNNSNLVAGLIDIKNINVGIDGTVPIGFSVKLLPGLSNGTVVSNQAQLRDNGGNFLANSDDPNDASGLADPAVPNDEYPTVVTIQTPQKPLKTIDPLKVQATIGEEVTYKITLPGTAYTDTLNNVTVTDVLDPSLEYVTATATLNGAPLAISTTQSGQTLTFGLGTIPAGELAVITLTTRIANTTTTNAGNTFTNSASFTYTGGVSGSSDPTTAIAVVEPALTAQKTVKYAAPSTKQITEPATVGDVLQYEVTLTNSGNSTAFDTTIVDTLLSSVTLVPNSTTVTIDGAPVTANPAQTGNTVTWGGNGELDIPAGKQLKLIFQVNVVLANGSPITNSVSGIYTSLNGASAYERNGTNCPNAPNDYCFSTSSPDISTFDPTTIIKSVASDTWDDGGVLSTSTDSTLRIGDTVVYHLALNLREGTIQNLQVTDTLPAELAYDSLVSITPAAPGSNFTYSIVSQPSAGATGTLTWNLGNLTNAIDHNTANDTFIIEFRARVLKNTLAPTPTTASLTNNVALSYTGSDPAAAALHSTASITVQQPLMTTPIKIERTGRTSPASVNVASDIMQFRLESCNNGTAPAYSIKITDLLATQLNETSIASLSVQRVVGGVASPLSAGTDYTYTSPAVRGGSMVFVLNTPINPNECVRIDYNIGFHNDVGPNQTWNNTVTLDEYWSLTAPTAVGQKYGPLGPTIYTMTNSATIGLPIKTLFSPASNEATIGQDVVYHIAVPGTPANAALYDVNITDNLNGALQYVGASDVSGNGFIVNDGTNTGIAPTQVKLTISMIPAGKQAIIEVRTRVANNASANAGLSFANAASYTFADSLGGTVYNGGSDATDTLLTIVEPTVTISKSVSPSTAPNAGDVLTYTVNLTALSGASYSNAYDLVLVDTLGTGLSYVTGSSTINGAPVTDPGISGQTLTWPAQNISEGVTVPVTYKVRVLDSVAAGQILANSATARWTSLSVSSTYERDGSGSPAYNDYFTTATTSLTVGDNTSLTKTRTSDTFNPADANVRPGDLVEYELRIGLQEGTTTGVVLSDTLPAGMVFDSMVSIDRFGTVQTPGPAPTTISGQTITWNLGDLVNPGDNNTANDYLAIKYRARVLNNLTQTATTPLSNSAAINYTVGGVNAPPKTDSKSINVLQPMLAVTKSVANKTGSGPDVSANEIITYRVDIKNSGAAPAYDTVLSDTIPSGLRQGGVTTTLITLLDATNTVTATLANLNPAYDAATGVATWNFDTGVADAYTIPAGYMLRVEYRVTADANLGAGLTLTNSAVASHYYSFDNNAIPSGNVNNREVYGPSNTYTTTLTSSKPGALLKEITQPTATIGEQFKYKITVPAVPASTALHDVRILDDLTTSAAELTYVSVTKTSGSATWTPVNTGTSTNLIIQDTTNGIEIPAGEQITIEITVQLTNNTIKNVAGRTFSNTATYTYNTTDNNPATQAAGLPGTSADMTIVEPTALTLTKTGPNPATMRVGTPGTFTLTVSNTGSSRAWDVTITDLLPNPTPGGMCSVAPVIINIVNSGQPVGTTYAAVTDYTTSLVIGTPTCTYTITGMTDKMAIDPGQTLTITYSVGLDVDNPPGIPLTNIAGTTQWFSQDTNGAGATGQTRTYTRILHDAVTAAATLDHEDAYTITTETPVLDVQKTVQNLTTGQPGTEAKPGDHLRYTITVTNSSLVLVPNFTLVDDLGALNAGVVFVPGSLTNISVPAGADYLTNTLINGGTNGAGYLDVRNLSLGASGTPTATVTITFDVTLASVIKSGIYVLNQGHLTAGGNPLASTDDPNVVGTNNPTQTHITSAPVMQVKKTSQDMTGDPNVLLPGDTLHYTITVKNVGNENATGVKLSDLIPAFTTYVAGTTRLNGNVVADPSTGVTALQSGMLINAPEDTTAGAMRADATATTSNVATITFDVKINTNALNGTIISNQGFVNGSGAGSGAFTQTPSDDPNTAAANDPTRNIVGSLPLLNATKTVTLKTDVNGNGAVDPGDVLHYTIAINNTGGISATGVNFTDAIPAKTTYVGGTTLLNGTAVADPSAGISAVEGGMLINAAGSASGTIPSGGSAVVAFDVTVNATGVNAGDTISNQGTVTSTELPSLLTDADGDPSNGYQPTTIVVGSAQQLAIVKEVSVVGGGAALPGSTLEFKVTVTNKGATAATNVVITDDLTPLLSPPAGQSYPLTSYVSGSAMLNNSTSGVTYSAPNLTANYSAIYGNLAPGATAVLTFRVTINSAAREGDPITNTAQVAWNTPAVTATANVTSTVGGIPGYAKLSGRVWHDANFNNTFESTERKLRDWVVEVYRNGTYTGNRTTTDVDGLYQFSGLMPTATTTDRYEVRFTAPGAGANTAKLGLASSIFTNSLQRISQIVAPSGSDVQNLDLPIDPNGIVYDSVRRTPIPGATLTVVKAGGIIPLPSSCFDDPAQQNQVTLPYGFYKFDLNFSDPACPSGADYVINVTAPGTGYEAGPSQIIPPSSSAATVAYSVPLCSADALPAPTGYCEAQTSENQPGLSVSPGTGTSYYLNLTLNTPVPNESQIFNNHIPVDPKLDNALTITKTAAVVNVSRGQFVPYTITVKNTFGVPLTNLNIVDTFPAGFKYVAGSSRFDGQPVEPVKTNRQIIWNNVRLDSNSQHTIKMLFIVGSGVSESEYVNQAQVFNSATGGPASGLATATVRVIPDPTFDCTDVIGKVFDDANRNGYQDQGEKGLPGVRVATVRGLLVTTDKYGRFHVTCAITPDENRGSNFVMKVDERTLPTGYRVTTENPLVLRATRGKMMKFDFGATIHKVVRLDLADGVFESGTTNLRIQWKPRLDLLLNQLKKGPSILRIGYMAEVEDDGLVDARVKAMKEQIARLWSQQNGGYELEIETEVFWRTGAPPERSAVK